MSSRAASLRALEGERRSPLRRARCARMSRVNDAPGRPPSNAPRQRPRTRARRRGRGPGWPPSRSVLQPRESSHHRDEPQRERGDGKYRDRKSFKHSQPPETSVSVMASGGQRPRSPFGTTSGPSSAGQLQGRSQDTMSAVTIPNIPALPSACVRMWQWKAHTPGASASTIASQRSPGATFSVSQRNAAGRG